MENNQAGLYIHIPFCLSKCGYCSFYSIASTQQIPEFVKAVKDEMSFYNDAFRFIDTIYIGGGTPSLLSLPEINEILNAVNSHFAVDRRAEITMEVNPGDVSFEYLRSLRKSGINRLNIGVQSFADPILAFLGRRHSSRQAADSVKAARRAGFENIGLDLIYGVHGQDMESWEQTLERAMSYSPEHLSCYQLSLEKKTPLFTRYKENRLGYLSENDALNFFIATSRLLTDGGYSHYEVSNYARDDSFRSRHNMKYWRHTPYLGLGPAAHSFLNQKRWWNTSAVKPYLKDISGGKKPVAESEKLSIEELALEALFLGMRTKDGVNLEYYRSRFGSDLLVEKRDVIEALLRNKLVELKNGSLCPTLAGMAVADALALI